MQKTERDFASPTTEAVFNRTRLEMSRVFTKAGMKTEKVLFQWGLLLLVVGFLLGRALILMKIMPFALPFFAAVMAIKKEKAPLASLAVLAGAFSVSIQNGGTVFATLFVFLLIHRFSGMLTIDPLKKLPFTVFIAMLLTKLTIFYVFTKEFTRIELHFNHDFLAKRALNFIPKAKTIVKNRRSDFSYYFVGICYDGDNRVDDLRSFG
jgi:stage II sporulation protein E